MTAEEWIAAYCKAKKFDWQKMTVGQQLQVTKRVPCTIRCFRVGQPIDVPVGEACPECGKISEEPLSRYDHINRATGAGSPPPMKQLYVVELTQEFLILADSPLAAHHLALEAAREDDTPPDVTSVSPMSYYPGEWDDDAIPYGDRDEEDPDRTVGEWIELGAAPQLKRGV